MDVSQENKIEKNSDLKEIIRNKPYFDDACMVHIALKMIADKWVLLILLSLIPGKRRTSELQKNIHGISPKMLSQSLKKLMDYDMVKRKIYPQVPPKVEYSLTEFGESTIPVLSKLFYWSAEWQDKIVTTWNKKRG